VRNLRVINYLKYRQEYVSHFGNFGHLGYGGYGYYPFYAGQLRFDYLFGDYKSEILALSVSLVELRKIIFF
jgi:hypothetical protein